MNPISLSWRFLARDWRAGELRLLLVALAVAVAALTSVNLFVDRMRQALSLEARQLLGADLVLATDRPPREAVLRDALARGLKVGRTVVFPSMAQASDQALLASVKAVSFDYPLRGELRVARQVGAADEAAHGAPPHGAVWVDARLLQALGLAMGDSLQLGDSTLRVDRVITFEPDRGTNFVNLAPRLLMSIDDLPATGLVQPSSRVNWRILFAGPARSITSFEEWLERSLEPGERLESLESGRPELRNTLDRAEKFLSLVALLTALIAAVAIGLGARRFAERHLDGCAVMRAIGISRGRLGGTLLMELLWLGLLGGMLGVAVGWAAHGLLVRAIASLVSVPLPAAGWAPMVQSMLAGLILLLGFAAWPLWRLAQVPPLRVIRRELGMPAAGAWITVGLALAAFASLLWWLAADRNLAIIALGGFAAGALVFSLATWLMLGIAPLMRRWIGHGVGGPALKLALASWTRRRGAAIAQTVAVAIGLMALILLTATRTDLLDGWRRATPADAPNRFLINIQNDQREEVNQRLAAAGIQGGHLYPMVRGRLIAVNGRPISGDDFADDRARRLIEREFNLSYMDQEPAHNRTVEGRWLNPQANEASGEVGIMRTLGLKVGDVLRFDIAGEAADVTLVGGRKLAWDSMQVNFFMILSPRALADRPQSWITAYHQPSSGAVDQTLVKRFPNLTVFDMTAILDQIQRMLDQVIQAVEALFVLTLVAGAVVMYAALAGSRDERIREAALMRALGASRRQLLSAQLWELGLAGGLAGLLAALGALAVGMVLAAQVFQFDYQPRWSTLGLGMLCGAAIAMVAGWFGLRSVLDSTPVTALRES